MKKVKVVLNELNKLYDEIYYANLDDIEQALEIISGIIYEKELEDSGDDVVTFGDIVDTITNVLDDISETMENEGLYDISEYIKDKTDKVHSGKLDEIIENSYLNSSDDDYDDEEYDIEDDEIDEDEDDSLDEYDEY